MHNAMAALLGALVVFFAGALFARATYPEPIKPEPIALPANAAPDLAGYYKVKSTTDTYLAIFRPQQHGRYRVIWIFSNGHRVMGAAYIEGQYLHCGWYDPGQAAVGVCRYRIVLADNSIKIVGDRHTDEVMERIRDLE